MDEITECLRSSQYSGPAANPQVYMNFDNDACASLPGGVQQVAGKVTTLYLTAVWMQHSAANIAFRTWQQKKYIIVVKCEWTLMS